MQVSELDSMSQADYTEQIKEESVQVANKALLDPFPNHIKEYTAWTHKLTLKMCSGRRVPVQRAL